MFGSHNFVHMLFLAQRDAHGASRPELLPVRALSARMRTRPPAKAANFPSSWQALQASLYVELDLANLVGPPPRCLDFSTSLHLPPRGRKGSAEKSRLDISECAHLGRSSQGTQGGGLSTRAPWTLSRNSTSKLPYALGSRRSPQHSITHSPPGSERNTLNPTKLRQFWVWARLGIGARGQQCRQGRKRLVLWFY